MLINVALFYINLVSSAPASPPQGCVDSEPAYRSGLVYTLCGPDRKVVSRRHPDGSSQVLEAGVWVPVVR